MEPDHDDLLARLKARADDDRHRVDEPGDQFTGLLAELPVGELLGMVREGGTALRALVAANAAGEAPPGPTPSGMLMIGGFDVLGTTRMMATPAVVARRMPASADDVDRVERALGLRLPRLLARVYTEVADGGVGPGEGLLPLHEATGPRTRSLVDEYEVVCEASEHGYGAPWPRHLLPVARWSDGVWMVVDTADPAHPVYEVDDGDVEDDDERPWDVPPVAPSLESWLEAWIAG
jgi:hypothetical protein